MCQYISAIPQTRERSAGMKSKPTFLLVFIAAIAAATLDSSVRIWATPAVGFTATTLVHRTITAVDDSKTLIPNSAEDDQLARDWLSRQEISGPSSLYVQSNVWQPGGTTGWHTHPGHSLIIVTAGTVTEYDGSDPDCKPHIYTRNMSFIDHGGTHVHIIRNEGATTAQTTAVQLIPAGEPRRIDIPNPGHCPF
jgi:hypothetical protein